MNTDLISRADAEALFRTARSKLNPSDYKTADEFNTRDLMLLNAEQMIHLLPSVAPKQEPSENAIYKVGDVVRTLVDIDAEGNKLFPKGTIGIITEIADYKDSLYPYKVDANEDWWYYSADMIEPVDEGGTPKQKPCEDDLIQRQAVLDIINFEDKWLLDAKGHNANTRIAFCGMRSKVSALPPATPEQRAGHWIYDRTRDWDGECKYECSCCGMGSDVDYAYCMRCGAKMVEPREESEQV